MRSGHPRRSATTSKMTAILWNITADRSAGWHTIWVSVSLYQRSSGADNSAGDLRQCIPAQGGGTAAHEPPHVMLVPRLRDIGLMEFNRPKEAIVEGRNLKICRAGRALAQQPLTGCGSVPQGGNLGSTCRRDACHCARRNHDAEF
jgi:hypothetical protein